jgi:hypothetical protein
MKKELKEAASTTKDVITHALKTGEIFERKAADRLKICRSCLQYDPKGWCKLCGCYLKVKAKLAGAKCPINKWQK